MNSAELKIQMLGEFSIRSGSQIISDNDNRSRKVWLLLAYMIYCRNHFIAQDELVRLLWGDEAGSSNPGNALKTMLHRVRSMLNQLGDGMGYSLISRREGSYAWNTEIPLFFDVDEFEALCKSAGAAAGNEEKLSLYLQALDLYRGDFLSKLSYEPWVVPISTYFHNLYIQSAQTTLTLLEARGRLEEVVSLCRRATVIDPYNEDLYRHLMRALLNQGNQRGAIQVFEEMSELLFSNFGIMPSDETKALFREAERIVNDRAVNIGTIREQLQEPPSEGGALLCDYDFFRVIYHMASRSIARSGDAVHIALLSVTGPEGDLSKRSLDRCMENLQDLIRINLRKGDVASRCSVSQYIIMLPQANYENSCMVMDRISKTFYRQYPHSPAVLHYSVQPLEPSA